MKAIVLTFDAQLEVANLVIESWLRLWPDCPLTFRASYTARDAAAIFKSHRVELLQSPIDIRSSMARLLDGIPDEEFVFWSIDDRFPVAIPALDVVRAVYEFVAANPEGVDSVRLTGLNRLAAGHDLTVPGDTLSIAGKTFSRQKGSMQHGYYMPQFCRARFLRRYFLSDHLPANYKIRDLHNWIGGLELQEAVYFPAEFFVQLGESTCEGLLTKICHDRFLEMGLTPPDIPVIADRGNRKYGGW